MRIDGLQRAGRWLLLGVVAQFCIGIATVFLKWPLAIAVMHNGGAAALVALTVMLNYKAALSDRIRSVSTASSAYPA
jgi:cytochrome c oxidase assembly protein subunit 15